MVRYIPMQTYSRRVTDLPQIQLYPSRYTNPGTDSLTPTLLQLTQYWLLCSYSTLSDDAVNSILFIALLSITFMGTGGFLVIRYKLFKMAVCQEITTVTLNLFLIFSACLVNDINIFDYTVLLLALIAAETAMALSLIIGSRGLSGRLSVRNNVSNYSTYLP